MQPGVWITHLLKWIVTPFILPFYYLSSFIAWFTLSKRSKRILYMASMYTHLQGVDVRSLSSTRLQEYLQTLNERLRLTKWQDKAILLPILIHQYIWRTYDRRLQKKDQRAQWLRHDRRTHDRNKHSHQHHIEELVRSTPMCLRYDKLEMMRDAIKVFYAVKLDRDSLMEVEPPKHPLQPEDPLLIEKCKLYRCDMAEVKNL